jgi:hypothetical protein
MSSPEASSGPQLAHGSRRRGPRQPECRNPSGELRSKTNRLLLARLRCEGPRSRTLLLLLTKDREAHEFCWRVRWLFFFKELRRGHEDAFAPANLFHLKSLIRVEPFADPYCDVDRFFDQIDTSIGDDDLHADYRRGAMLLRIAFKFREENHDLSYPRRMGSYRRHDPPKT